MHISTMISFVTLFVPDASLLSIFHVEAIYQPKRFASSASDVNSARADLKVVYANLSVEISNQLVFEFFNVIPYDSSVLQPNLIIVISIKLVFFTLLPYILDLHFLSPFLPEHSPPVQPLFLFLIIFLLLFTDILLLLLNQQLDDSLFLAFLLNQLFLDYFKLLVLLFFRLMNNILID